MMNLQKILLPLGGVALVVLAYRAAGWGGVALVGGAIVMWMLLHFTRMMKVLQRAADRPVGYCDSAVMLNARLRPGVTLLHVVTLTRALGEQLGEKDVQPEVFRWTDPGGSHVTCEFRHGKLATWALWRPPEAQAGEPQAGTGAAGADAGPPAASP